MRPKTNRTRPEDLPVYPELAKRLLYSGMPLQPSRDGKGGILVNGKRYDTPSYGQVFRWLYAKRIPVMVEEKQEGKDGKTVRTYKGLTAVAEFPEQEYKNWETCAAETIKRTIKFNRL